MLGYIFILSGMVRSGNGCSGDGCEKRNQSIIPLVYKLSMLISTEVERSYCLPYSTSKYLMS